MKINDDTQFPGDTPASPEVTTNARRRARVRLLPLLAVLVGVLAAVGANLIEAPRQPAGPYALSSAATETDKLTEQTATPDLTAPSAQPTTLPTTPSTSSDTTPSTSSDTTSSTSSGTTPSASRKSPAATTSTNKDEEATSDGSASGATPNSVSTSGREPSTTWSTTPEPEVVAGSFNGRDFGYGALVGRDIKAGRYWSTGCVGWRHFDNDRIISSWSRHSQQSLVDLRNGETLLSGCHWNAGNPPAADVIPTGKVSLVSQLTPGKYRPKNEICMTGPADTRSTDAIADSSEYFAWESKPADHVLVITGRENWVAYGISAECGGLVRIG